MMGTMNEAIRKNYMKLANALEDENKTDEELSKLVAGAKVRGRQQRKSLAFIKSLKEQRRSRVARYVCYHSFNIFLSLLRTI